LRSPLLNGLEFMGKEWDNIGDVRKANRGTLTNMVNADGKPKFQTRAPAFDLSLSSQLAMQQWHADWLHACFRVLMPGGRILAFGGSRVYHRMAAAFDDVGFVDVGLEAWNYGSGFPKSKNIALFIDKAAKATGDRGRAIPTASLHLPGEGRYSTGGEGEKLTSNPVPPYAPVTDEARTWNGWGTALKPAWEPVLVGRKPLS